MQIKPLYVAAALAAATAVPAHAATILNGSFETGTLSGAFSTVGTGDTSIANWDVISGTVDYIGSHWQAQDGSRSIDLAGNAIGSLAQSFATVLGETYVVSFYLSRNPDGGINPRTGTVSATGNASQLLSYANATSTTAAMDWQRTTYQFTATGALTTLTFAADATSQGLFGLALDDVSIATVDAIAVPEPSTWAMTILGLGLVGFVIRKKPRRTVRYDFA